MRQSAREPGRPGPKTIWDDLLALYESFGTKEKYELLLVKLAWSSGWGAQAAAILNLRREGRTLEQIATDLEVNIAPSIFKLERQALRVLREMQGDEAVPVGKPGESSGPTIWNNPQGIVNEYGGPDNFRILLGRLSEIEMPWQGKQKWGQRLVDILQARLAGKSPREIGEAFKVSGSRVISLCQEALSVLDCLLQNEPVCPPRRKKSWEEVNQEFTHRYGTPKIFWDYLEKLSWLDNWGAEEAAVLRALAMGWTLQQVGDIFTISREAVRLMKEKGLTHLDALVRGEEAEPPRYFGGSPLWRGEV